MAKFDVIEWMAKHGHPSYKRKIAKLTAAAKIFENDDMIIPTIISEKIEEIRQLAQDRYDDWASD